MVTRHELIASARACLVSFNTPLGRADRFRPAPPDLPAPETPEGIQSAGHTPALLGLELFTWQRSRGPIRPVRPVARRGIITPLEGLSTTRSRNLSLFFPASVAWTAAEVHGVELPATPFTTIAQPGGHVKPYLSRPRKIPATLRVARPQPARPSLLRWA